MASCLWALARLITILVRESCQTWYSSMMVRVHGPKRVFLIGTRKSYSHLPYQLLRICYVVVICVVLHASNFVLSCTYSHTNDICTHDVSVTLWSYVFLPLPLAAGAGPRASTAFPAPPPTGISEMSQKTGALRKKETCLVSVVLEESSCLWFCAEGQSEFRLWWLVNASLFSCVCMCNGCAVLCWCRCADDATCPEPAADCPGD